MPDETNLRNDLANWVQYRIYLTETVQYVEPPWDEDEL